MKENFSIEQILTEVKGGTLQLDTAERLLRELLLPSFSHSRLDVSREERTGIEEVVFAQGKTPREVCDVTQALYRAQGKVLATRVSEEQVSRLKEIFPNIKYNQEARVVSIRDKEADGSLGRVAVLTAGTSDLRVAHEILAIAEYFNLSTQGYFDVGVAGLYRVLEVRPKLDLHDAVIVVAGMDGALASVVSGLSKAPVVAVPTSVGYGAAFEGVSALLSMLVSCSPGVTVVNIDNGLGAVSAVVKMLKHTKRTNF